jgi:hypothetical protein
MTDLTDPIFHDANAAREHLESIRWPDGPWCPHCDSENVKRLEGKSYTAGALWFTSSIRAASWARPSTTSEYHATLHQWLGDRGAELQGRSMPSNEINEGPNR